MGMNLLFQGRKLEKRCNDQEIRIKAYGQRCAKLLERRLKELRAVENLEALFYVVQARCHELKGDRKGILAVDLEHPYRLLFEPAHDPVPMRPDGGLDWMHITDVRILSVEDYHG
jgi:plasmid maintenance system killer protein